MNLFVDYSKILTKLLINNASRGICRAKKLSLNKRGSLGNIAPSPCHLFVLVAVAAADLIVINRITKKRRKKTLNEDNIGSRHYTKTDYIMGTN